MDKMAGTLVIISKASKMLAETKTVPELREVAAVGHTAIEHAKRLRVGGFEAMCNAAEIVLRAERRLGEMLASQSLNGGDRKSESRDERVKLSDLGISAMQSHRWQAAARVPEEMFQQWFAETVEAGKQPTSGALIKLGKQSHRKQWAEPTEPIEGTCGSLRELIDDGKKFRCIYADPPWQYDNQETRASTDNHYGTMSVAQICAEPVAAVAADDCHLHLWTTNAFLFAAREVMDAWGFDYRSVFVWCKPQMGIGNYWRVSHELMLLGVRGKATNFLANDEMSWIQADRTKHSRKPRQVREKIERVSPGPYLEMYGREKIEGWTVYGNQIEHGLFG